MFKKDLSKKYDLIIFQSITELSERSSRPSSRGTDHKTPPPPPMRSSSKGAVENSIPPLPARNYDATDAMPRYVPAPGRLIRFLTIVLSSHQNTQNMSL